MMRFMTSLCLCEHTLESTVYLLYWVTSKVNFKGYHMKYGIGMIQTLNELRFGDKWLEKLEIDKMEVMDDICRFNEISQRGVGILTLS